MDRLPYRGVIYTKHEETSSMVTYSQSQTLRMNKVLDFETEALNNSVRGHWWEYTVIANGYCFCLRAPCERVAIIFTNESVVGDTVSLLVVHHVELGEIFGGVPNGEGGTDPSVVPLKLHFLQPVRVWKSTRKLWKFLVVKFFVICNSNGISEQLCNRVSVFKIFFLWTKVKFLFRDPLVDFKYH